jgi:hypothetical protein
MTSIPAFLLGESMLATGWQTLPQVVCVRGGIWMYPLMGKVIERIVLHGSMCMEIFQLV